MKLKNFKHLSRIFFHYKLKNRILPYSPIRAWLEPTNKCNLKCTLCPNSMDTTSERGNMDYELFVEIADQLAGRINDVNLSHRGESLFHPDITKMIRYCNEKGMKTRIHSNATQLNREMSTRLIDSGLDLMSFSFDGFDKETYERIRRNAHFEETLENIVEFLRIKSEKGVDKPFTIIQVIMEQGYRETEKHKQDFMNHFAGLPLDRLYVKEAHNWGGNMEIGANTDNSNVNRRFSMCTFPWYAVTILWDGKVVPCPQDWFGAMELGNLKKQDLETIWNQSPMFDLRTRMAHQDLKGILCESCDRPWRKNVLGVPVENAKTFLKEHIFGYKTMQSS